MGISDKELNVLNIYLTSLTIVLSLIIILLKGFNVVTFIKFIILFSSIIPISLRVKLEYVKTWFSYVITKDKTNPETIARNRQY